MNKRKLVAIITTLAMLVAMFSMVNAAEKEYKAYGKEDGLWNSSTALFHVKELNGQNLVGAQINAYCADDDTSIDYSKVYTLGSIGNDVNSNKVRAILNGSYPAIDLGVLKTRVNAWTPNNLGNIQGQISKEEAITGTQWAIWNYTNGTTPDYGWFTDNEDLICKYLLSLSGMPSSFTQATASVSVSGQAQADGSAVFTVSYSALASDGSTVMTPTIVSNKPYTQSAVTGTTTKTFTATVAKADFNTDLSFSVTVDGTQNFTEMLKFVPKLKSNNKPETQALVGSATKSYPVTMSASATVTYVPPTT